MKAKITSVAVLCVALSASNAFAEARETSFELGLETYRETYEEFVDGRKFMQEEARMVGLTGSATVHIDDASSVKFGFRYARGKSDYTGAYQGETYGSLTSDGQTRSAAELRAAYQFHQNFGNVQVIPSIGLGYRRLTDYLEEAQGGGGYHRVNQLTFATVGIEARIPMGGRWKIAPKVGYNHLLWGQQESGGILRNIQRKGYGFDVSADVSTKFGAQADFKVTPFLRYWKIRDSDAAPYATYTQGGQTYVVYGMEPQNKTTEVGVNLNLNFY